MIDFRCPVCSGSTWGTSGMCGACRSCNFQWNRRHDFRVFVREDGSGFASAAELNAAWGGPLWSERLSGRDLSTAELLQDVLSITMARPPTVGVVALWSRDEQRAALRWASCEILAEIGMVGRLPRPPFIEDGAATA